MKTDYDLEERLLEYSARIIRLVESPVIRIFVRSIQTAKQRKR